MSESPVRSVSDGGVAVITVDDGKANALSFGVIEALSRALDAAESDGSVTAVAILGREGKFSAGFDLSVMTGGVDGARKLLSDGAVLGLRVFSFPKPVVFGITGHALAMGAILTVCADYRVGADGPYKLGLNEVAIGMPVPSFGVELCRQRLSPAWFTRCVQHAHICSPTEAREAGFLDEVVAPDSVADRAVAMATLLGGTVKAGPFRTTRRNMRGQLTEQLRAGLIADMALFDVST